MALVERSRTSTLGLSVANVRAAAVDWPLAPLPDGPPMSDVTRILSQIEEGDPQAAEKLLPLVYDELRKLAAVKLAQEKPGQTLQATALVHEAWLRLVGGGQRSDVRDQKSDIRDQKSDGGNSTSDLRRRTSGGWDSRGHFFAAAAEAIRRILVERARKKGREVHGGGRQRIDLEEAVSLAEMPREELLSLNEALDRFAALEPAKAEFVKLRYFAGFSIDEAADLLGISRTTAKRYWVYARSWLLAELFDADGPRNS